MDFTFSSEQEESRAAARRFLADHRDDAEWSQLVDLGWTAILVPETHDGLGLGLVDLVPVLEEMGRVRFGGPFLSSGVFATIAARHLGLGHQLESLASGTTRGTIALDEKGHGDPVGRIRTRAVRKAGQWQLTGEKPFVLDGDRADWVLVVARAQQGIGTFLVEAPNAAAVPVWDVTRVAARLELDARPADPVGPEGDQTAIWRRIADDCAVALCAELIGTMEAANDLAVEYAKARVQFGRPIATFQAIKHKAADMLHRQELARVGTHYAAWASDAEAPDREHAAAMAKSYAAEAAVHVTSECIQIHGGVGFTWDCDAHLHYRRAKQADLLLGYQGWQRQRLADLVLEPA